METFFQTRLRKLTTSPNQRIWWHALPLPDGSRIDSVHLDKDLQLKMWNALGLARDGITGKNVLDIGAADGFFSIAARMAGAATVTSIGTGDWSTWPHNIELASKTWDAPIDIITGDFRTHEFARRFDVILFLGVLYHIEDVFGAMKLLRELLGDGGSLYIETQMTAIASELPVFEYASDIYATIAPQDKPALGATGISNYLFPNEAAMLNLAHSYDFDCRMLDGSHNTYTLENPTRRMFRFTRR
ncbi:MAG TPA: class I SAM-dependent methyltransferase [Casimicrobiaceae bacterium]|nr:class I SAM-dependent methyltransferase [Casimicrobiaceae bacterium]